MDDEHPGRTHPSAGVRKETRGALITIAAFAAAEIVARTPLYDPDWGVAAVAVAVILTVVYVAFRGGLRVGLASAAIATVYIAYFYSIPGRHFRYTEAEALRRTLVVAGLAFVLALVVGALRERVDHLIGRERMLRRSAEGARVEAEAARRDAEGARAAAEAEAEWSGFLARASRVLAASLDYQATLKSVVHLAVPSIADWCTVDYMDKQSGEVDQFEVAATVPSKAELARKLRERYPPKPGSHHPILDVLRTGKPKLIPEIPDALLERVARDEEHRRILRGLGFKSAMVVPLHARGRTLGAITFVSSDSGRRYGPADLRLAEELARRAALAIDNARLYQDAERASRAKSNFLAVMSHELRTPLNAIIGYADLLLLGVKEPLPGALRREVERILGSARQLLELIEEVLTYSRTEAGLEVSAWESADLRVLAREAAAPVAPSAVEKGLRFEVHVPDRRTEIETDPGKLKQILTNLLSNAVKFTDDGMVELTAHTQGESVTFQVRDTGTGIPQEELDAVFDPFWQADQRLTRRTGGTGLGLTVSKRLANLLGGDVAVESEVGRGSTFTVRLPRSASAAMSPDRSTDAARRAAAD